MGGLIEDFAEGVIKGVAKNALDPFVAKGEIDAEQEDVMCQAIEDAVQLFLAARAEGRT